MSNRRIGQNSYQYWRMHIAGFIPITGFTPFFANHGREARQPSDQWMDEFVKLNFTSGTTLDDYAHKLQKAMMNCWKSASQRRIEKHNRADEAKLLKNTRHPK